MPVPPPSSSTTAGTVSDRPADAPTVLVAGMFGIATSDGIGLVDPPEPAEVALHISAHPDGRGGLVWATLADLIQNITWWPAGSEPRLASMQPGQALHDVGLIDGQPVALVTRINPGFFTADEPLSETLHLIDLGTGAATDLGEVGTPEVTAAWAALGPDSAAVVQVDRTCGALVILSFSGEPISSAISPPDCSVLFSFPFGPVAFGPEGRLVYIELDWEDADAGPFVAGATLVVPTVDASPLRIALPAIPENLTALDFDGRWAVISGWDGDGPSLPLLIDTVSGVVVELPLRDVEEARFLSGPLEVG